MSVLSSSLKTQSLKIFRRFLKKLNVSVSENNKKEPHKMKRFLFIAPILLFSIPVKVQANEQFCREFTKEILIGNNIEQGYGTACLQPDGSWQVISEGPSETRQNYHNTILIKEKYTVPTYNIHYRHRHKHHRKPYHRHYRKHYRSHYHYHQPFGYLLGFHFGNKHYKHHRKHHGHHRHKHRH